MRPNTLKLLRRYHHYLGVFFAPYILLFAVSGALQTFRLNEARGYGGPPPQWMVWLSSVHKDQGPPRAPRPDRPRPLADTKLHGERSSETKRPNPLPLKIFVLLMAIALAVSTVLGVVIALANRALRRVSIALLVAGTVLPAILLWL